MEADDASEVDFHHPFTPYDVQIQFMRAVYGVLEKGGGQVGILESPTGTVRTAPTLWYVPPMLIVDHRENHSP